MDKLTKGTRILLANTNNLAFVLGVFQRKLNWRAEDQGLQLEVAYSFNLLTMPIFSNGLVKLNTFNRYGVIHDNNTSQQLIHLAQNHRMCQSQNRVRDALKIEGLLLALLEHAPEFTYVK